MLHCRSLMILTTGINLFVFLFRDISFLYDATVPDKTGLDSAGNPLVTLSSDKNKTSPGSKQLELVEKTKGESDQEAVVNIRIDLFANFDRLRQASN